MFLLVATAATATTNPITFTYQGRLTDGSGLAISNSTVNLTFRILNPAGTCVIYSETQVIDTSGSSGVFSAEIGSATGSSKRNLEDSGHTMSTVFSNQSASITGRLLSSLVTSCSYTPSAGDDRKLQVFIINVGTTSYNLALSPLQRISSVPYATVAQTLNGYTSDQFLRLNGTVVAPSANVTGGNVNTLMDLLFASSSAGYNKLNEILSNYTTGTGFTFSSLNMSMGGNRITGVGTPTAGTDAVNKNYSDGRIAGQTTSGLGSLAAGDSGKALVWDGSNWVAQAIDALPSQTGNSGRFLTTNGTAASWSVISQVPTQTGHSGKFLTTDGTTASWATVTAGTVSSVGTNAPLELQVPANASSTPVVQFTPGSVANDGFIFSLTNGNQPGFVNPATNFVLKGGQTGAVSLGSTNANAVSILTNNTTRLTVDSSGNVGVGTAAPTAQLHIAGGTSATAWGSNGIAFRSQAATFTDTTSSGAVATQTNINNFGPPTLAASSPAVYATAATVAIGGAPIAGANVSITAPLAFSVQAGNSFFAGNVGIGSTAPVSTLDVGGVSPIISLSNNSAVMGNLYFDTAWRYRADGFGGVMKFFNAADGGGIGFYVAGTNNTSGAGATASPSEVVRMTPNGNVGIGTTNPTVSLDLATRTDAIRIPAGTTAQQPSSPAAGMIRWNTTTSAAELYNGTAWTSLGVSGGLIGAGSGTAAAPSLGFSGDTDTGLFSSAADTLGFSTGGTNRFNLSSAGFVSTTAGGGLVTTAAGTASAPTFSFAGDPDTGWFSPAANTLASATGGTERVRIDSSGNVGIGTTNPGMKLDIDTGGVTNGLNVTTGNGQVSARFTAPGTTYLDFFNTAGPTGQKFMRIGGQGGSLTFENVNDAYTSASNIMTLLSTGNVGIGTTSPATPLHVNGNSTFNGAMDFRLGGSSSNAWIGGNTNVWTDPHLHIGGYGSSPNRRVGIWADTTFLSGNVGIGTWGPAAKLDIAAADTTQEGGEMKLRGAATYRDWGIDVYQDDFRIFSTNQGTGAGYVERFRIDDNTGNVGIGTINPIAKLTVQSSGGVNSGFNLNLSSASSYAPIDFNTPSGLSGQFLSTGSGYSNGIFTGDQIALASYINGGKTTLVAGGTGAFINFATGGYLASDERMRITSNGNVGIGTVNPVARLTVVGGNVDGVQVRSTSNSPGLVRNCVYRTSTQVG